MFLAATSSCRQPAEASNIEKKNFTGCQKCTLITDLALSTLIILAGVYFLLQNSPSQGWNAFSIAGCGLTSLGAAIAIADVVRGMKLKMCSTAKEVGRKEIDPQEEIKKQAAIFRVRQLRAMPMNTKEEKLALIEKYVELYPDAAYYRQHNSDSITGIVSAEVEFQKTMLSFLCLMMIKNRDYEAFVAAQDPDKTGGVDPILPEEGEASFNQLCDLFDAIFPGDEGFDFICSINAFHDVAKLRPIREQWGDEDELVHDAALFNGMNRGLNGEGHAVLRTFNHLSLEYQDYARRMWGTGFLGPQFVQGEAVYDDLTNIARMLRTKDPKDMRAIQMMFAQELLDIIGAWVKKSGADPLYNGSPTLRQNTFKNFLLMKEVFEAQETFEQTDAATGREIYLQYYQRRGQELGFEINPKNPDTKNLAIIRICCALRFNALAQGQRVKQIYERLPEETQEKLEEFFYNNDVKLMYMPDLLQKAEAKGKLAEGLTILATMYNACQENDLYAKGNQKAPTLLVNEISNKIGSIKEGLEWKFVYGLNKQGTAFVILE